MKQVNAFINMSLLENELTCGSIPWEYAWYDIANYVRRKIMSLSHSWQLAEKHRKQLDSIVRG